jgi:hypothetical protein
MIKRPNNQGGLKGEFYLTKIYYIYNFYYIKYKDHPCEYLISLTS